MSRVPKHYREEDDSIEAAERHPTERWKIVQQFFATFYSYRIHQYSLILCRQVLRTRLHRAHRVSMHTRDAQTDIRLSMA